MEIHRFTLEQVKAISSPMRGLAFQNFTALIPRSASDVAKLVGKSAQSLHHHVQILQDVGLILPVGSRQKHARTETLYVAIAPICRFLPDQGEEYEGYAHRMFKLEVQKMSREYAHAIGLRSIHPEIRPVSQYRRFHLHLTLERANKLLEDVAALYSEARLDQEPDNPDALRINTMFYIMPTLSQTKSMAEEAGVPFESLNRERGNDKDE